MAVPSLQPLRSFGVSFVGFVFWELGLIRCKEGIITPIFPVRLATDRAVGAVIVVTGLNGFVWYIALANLPNRFQIVMGDSSVPAGLRLLRMMVAACGTFSAGMLSEKRNLTALTTVTAISLKVIRYGLMTTLGSSEQTLGELYGFEVLLGLGFGMSIASATLMLIWPYQKSPEHTGPFYICHPRTVSS